MDAKTILIINAIYSIIVSLFIILGSMTKNKNVSLKKWGGEEFLLYISNVDEVSGESVVNKILKTIQDSRTIYEDKEIEETLSIGAVYTIGTQYPLEELVSAADRELYRAKDNGKNQVQYKVMVNR